MISGLRELRLLDLANTSIRINPGFFKHTKKIVYLHLSRNDISYLEPGSFQGLSNLRFLFLLNSSLGNINSDLFVGLENLDGLFFENNSLEDLNEEVFERLQNIRIIQLNANNFASFPTNFFKNNKLLMRLFISCNKNKILTLPPKFLADKWKLDFIKITNNRVLIIY